MTSMTSAVTAELAPISSMDLSLSEVTSATEATERPLKEVAFYGLAFGSAVMSGIAIGFSSVGPWVHQIASLMV